MEAGPRELETVVIIGSRDMTYSYLLWGPSDHLQQWFQELLSLGLLCGNKVNRN